MDVYLLTLCGLIIMVLVYSNIPKDDCCKMDQFKYLLPVQKKYFRY